jgi:hypothetical protein
MDKKQEAALIDSTLKLLRRGKFELSGDEALVFHSCFQYLVKKLNDLNKPEVVISPVVEPVKGKKK